MSTTRRHFLTTAAMTATAFAQIPSPSDRLRIALIGAGGQGSGDTANAIQNPGVELVAVSDVYEGRLTRAKERWGDHLFTTRDYREVLARPDVDAVIVATPDHWHRTISIDAMNAGKDVYCEKPMVQHVDDGKDVIEAQTRTKRIFQVGSQRVSSLLYQKMKDLLAAGAIGELNTVEAWIDRGTAIGAWEYSIPPDASPATVDWDRFLGRAPKVPFEPVRLFRWRNYRDYGTGIGGDLFVHLFSGMHYVTNTNGPARVFATGGLRFWKDARDVPDVLMGLYDYPTFNVTLRVNLINGSVNETSGFRFIGSEGAIALDGNTVTLARVPRAAEPGYTIDTFPKALQEQFLKQYRAKYPERPAVSTASMPEDEKFVAPRGYSDHFEHIRNWVNSVRTRKPAVEDAVFGFRAAGPALLSNISYFEQRPCRWDPEKMELKA